MEEETIIPQSQWVHRCVTAASAVMFDGSITFVHPDPGGSEINLHQ